MRIVSLLPSATEILFAIGAGDEVVAVTHECDHPAAARALPAVTSSLIDHEGSSPATVDRHIQAARHSGSGIYALDSELLARLDPELIVTQELCDVCAVAYSQVETAVRRLPGAIPILSLEPGTLDEIVATVEAVGRVCRHEAEASAVAAEMRRRIGAVAALPAPETAPRVVCVEWTDPIMAGGHWVPEMVRVAGGVDPLGEEGRPSRYVEWDEVLAARPDVLVLMPCGHGLERTLELAPEITGRPGFAELPAALSGRIVAVDGSGYFNRPGPRIVEGLEMLAAIARARPGEPLPQGAAWVAPVAGVRRD